MPQVRVGTVREETPKSCCQEGRDTALFPNLGVHVWWEEVWGPLLVSPSLRSSVLKILLRKGNKNMSCHMAPLCSFGLMMVCPTSQKEGFYSF